MTLKAEKIAGIIQKEISEIIQFSLKDPKIGFITITDVTVTNDLSIAKIYVSFLGTEAKRGSRYEGTGSQQGLPAQRARQANDDP